MEKSKQKDTQQPTKQEPDPSNAEILQMIRCETCLYADHCDGYEFAPFCMMDLAK